MKKYETLFLSGIISEDVYYQIQELDQNGMLTEGIFRDLMHAGLLGAGMLGAGTLAQPLIQKAQMVSQDQINDPASYANAAINKIKSGVQSVSVQGGGNVQIDSIKITGKDKSGKIFVKVTGKAANVDPSNLSRAASEALNDIMGDHHIKGTDQMIRAAWPERNEGFYTDDVPAHLRGTVRETPKDPTPFSATIIITPWRVKAI